MTDIHLREKTLTDGSSVFDVELGDVVLPCVSRQDAFALALKLCACIHMHTNEEAVLFTHEAPAPVFTGFHGDQPDTRRPGDMAAYYAEENGVSYSEALVACNMD